MLKDYYKILKISKNASLDDIKKAYKDLAIQYHPDKTSNDPELLDKFKNITEAHNTLGNEVKKLEYDKKYKFSNDYNFFGSMFGANKSKPNFMDVPLKKESPRGTDVIEPFYLSLEEISEGCEKTIHYKRMKYCSSCDSTGASTLKICNPCNGSGLVNGSSCVKCNGSGRLPNRKCKVCKGSGLLISTTEMDVYVDSFSMNDIIIQDYGNYGANSGQAGKLILQPVISDSRNYEVSGLNVVLYRDVNISDVVLGSELDFKFGDVDFNIQIPRGHDYEKLLKVKGYGLKKEDNRGDLFIRLRIIIPQNLTEEQESIFETLKKMENPFEF